MASPNPLPLRANSAAGAPPSDPLPHAAAVAPAPATTETIVEGNPSSEKLTKFSAPPTGRHKPRSSSNQLSGAPLSSSCHAHQPQLPPTPLLTPPTSAAPQPYYTTHPGSYQYYPNQGYPLPGGEYGGGQQSRRPSFIQSYPSPVEGYQFAGSADDGRIYGLNPAGTDPSILPYGADLHADLEAIIHTTQGALSALHSAVPSLQHLYGRYRQISDELVRYKSIVASREKETEELRAKESKLTTAKNGLEDTLRKSIGDFNRLKGARSSLEKEGKRLQEAIKALESEKSELKKKLEVESVTFEKWKANLVNERETERSALESEKSELRKKLEVENATFEKWKADILHEQETERSALESEKSDLEKKFEEERTGFQAWKDKNLNDRETEKRALESEKSKLEKKLEEEKAAFETWKVSAENDWETEKLALTEDHEAEIKRLEESFKADKETIEGENQVKISELYQTHREELRSLEASSDAELKDAEEKHKTKVEAINNARLREVMQLESDHGSRVEALEKKFSLEKEALEKRSNTQAKGMEDDFEQRTRRLEAEFASEKRDIVTNYNAEISKLQEVVSSASEDRTLLDDTRAELEEEKAQSSALKREKESLVAEKDRAEAQRSKLETEMERLQTMYNESVAEIQTMSDAMKEMADTYEGSGQGDNYYVDAFKKLGKDIVEISEEFSHLPTEPSNEILAKLPPGLPAMFDNTDASRHIRVAYAQHIISKHLCRRIFEPFLFSLRRRSGSNADELFNSISTHLREKSTRKEAAWRRYTLLAAFRTPDAKKSAEGAARSIVDEIVEHVKPFADPEGMGVIKSGISRIVKYAIETWRYARTERETISASMGPDNGTDENSWQPHPYEQQTPYDKDLALVSQLKAMAPERKVIIHLLPVFSREGALPPPLGRPSADLDSGRVFSKGIALYTDCLPVLQRKHELGPLIGPTPSLAGTEEADSRVGGEDSDSPGGIEEDEARIEGEGIAQEEQAPLPQGEVEGLVKDVELEATEEPAGGEELAPTTQEEECLAREAAEAAAASERTPTELGTAEDEDWGPENAEEMAQKALENVQDMEQETPHFIEALAPESSEALPETQVEVTSQTERPLTPPLPKPFVHIPRPPTPLLTDETENTDDTLETAPEQQPEPCDSRAAIIDVALQGINHDAMPPAAKAKGSVDVFEEGEAVENVGAEVKDVENNNKTEKEPLEKVAVTTEFEHETEATGGVKIPSEITVTAGVIETREPETKAGAEKELLDEQREQREREQKEKEKKEKKKEKRGKKKLKLQEQKEQGQQQGQQQGQPRQQHKQRERERSQAGPPNLPVKPSQIPTRTATPATAGHPGTPNGTWRAGLMRAQEMIGGSWRPQSQGQPTHPVGIGESVFSKRDHEMEEGHADSETDASVTGRSSASSVNGGGRGSRGSRGSRGKGRSKKQAAGPGK